MLRNTVAAEVVLILSSPFIIQFEGSHNVAEDLKHVESIKLFQDNKSKNIIFLDPS